MSKKVVTIQDISCYGQCSTTVALPILSSYGVETAILPSGILSTHTSGFKNFTFLDLTEEMPKILSHWIDEGIKFDAIYTGYIGDPRQFDLILEAKEKVLKPNGVFIVDPAMADNGKLYPALNLEIVEGMKKICAKADYIIPNITEACFLTGNEYHQKLDRDYVNKLKMDCYKLGAKNVIITGISYDPKTIGAVFFNGEKDIEVLGEYQPKSYHGTGDIFSSVIVAGIVNSLPMKDTLKEAVEFIIKSIKKTCDDDTHSYGVKFEDVLNDK